MVYIFLFYCPCPTNTRFCFVPGRNHGPFLYIRSFLYRYRIRAVNVSLSVSLYCPINTTPKHIYICIIIRISLISHPPIIRIMYKISCWNFAFWVPKYYMKTMYCGTCGYSIRNTLWALFYNFECGFYD